jgi:hypothetical protein
MRDDHLFEWDHLDIRLRGTSIQKHLSEFLREKRTPISDLRLKFLDGELHVSARIQKGVPIPVKVTVRKITVAGKVLRVALDDIATFGILPIPKLLFQVLGSRKLHPGVSFDAGTMTLTVSLDRLLPDFLDIALDSVEIIRGGIALHLGNGGAGLPKHQATESARRY